MDSLFYSVYYSLACVYLESNLFIQCNAKYKYVPNLQIIIKTFRTFQKCSTERSLDDFRTKIFSPPKVKHVTIFKKGKIIF